MPKQTKPRTETQRPEERRAGPAPEKPSPTPVATPPAPASPPKAEPRYNFKRYVRCPRCGSTQTERTGQHGATQYRVCTVPIPPCGHRFSVQGTQA